MLGNDVVDLLDPEVRPGAAHPRFDRRVFAACELRALRASADPQRLRWMLWAAKEAAYKLARKLERRTIFSPPRFVVRLDGTGNGEVRYAEQLFRVRVESRDDSVHAVAASRPLEAASLHAGVIGVPQEGLASPGAIVRRHVVRRVAELLGTDPAGLAIVKAGRIPFVCRGSARLPIDLSLSHHGRYAAYAYELPPAEGSA